MTPTPKTEGFLALDGLIEGPMPPFPDMQAKLERWSAAWPQLRFHLQIDAGHFSAMPANDPIATDAFGAGGGDPTTVIADALSDLLRLFPPVERRQVFSTLRGVEWQHKLEIRTVYAAGPEGRAATRQERVPCDTVALPQPLSPREMLVRGGIGVLVAAGILGLSSFVIDYPKLWRRLTATTEPAHVVADVGPFAPYLKVELLGLDHQAGLLQLRVTRLPDFPATDQQLDALYDHPPEIIILAPTTPTTSTAPATAPTTGPATSPTASLMSLLRRRLAIEAIARGTVRLVFYDVTGCYLGEVSLRLSDLRDRASAEVSVPAPLIANRPQVPASLQLLP